MTLLLWLPALSLAAQQPTHACTSVVEPAQRLACYDKAFPPPPEVSEAATERAQASFGLDKPRETLRNPGQTVEQADPERIESRVVKVDYAHGGQRSFSLENGQVWRQAEARSTGHVRAGDVVQVRKAIMGGYRLLTPDGVGLRVSRAR
ncbi:hypothetical protein [Luteimonas sp. SDU101]|uniref:hypothetical protein n=1 Tax=unclassified Luteimonas TaxID=2629088 RepID=UPI003EBB6B80